MTTRTLVRWSTVGLVLVALLWLMDGKSGAQPPESLSVLLEWFANPDHAPLYIAQAKGYFSRERLRVEIREPADPSQVPFLVAAGAVDIGLTSMFNHVILKATQNINAIAIGALLMKPLGALVAIKERGIEKITDLKGKKIGYSVEPVEPAVYSTMLRAAGLDPQRDVTFVKLDFLSLLPALLAGTVDAIGAFRNFEPVRVELAGLTPVVFNQEDYGAPEAYQLIFIVRRELLTRRPEALQRFLKAFTQGVLFVLAFPQQSKELFFQTLPQLKDELNLRAYDRTVPIFAGAPCHNDPKRWEIGQNFLFEQKIIPRTLPLSELYTASFLPEGCF
ncbi:MAG: ABC transporter substrate-binding protein [Candidatus Bipolaricaulota bacterium]|nr:ABC transporter substrate-binding protein [Candidatus Bipolaricaulota bacterium]MDW8031297.1 ABC transporter substrate-binding protein [Candidatus Bipolaricaulota bacterium]